MFLRISLFFLLLVQGCAPVHIKEEKEPSYFIVFLVNARQLDSSSLNSFFKTLAKHPSDGSKNGDVGHAWIYLQGDHILEGGHSGERGTCQPGYMEGVCDNIALGAKDPVAYLWSPQCDGYFQWGNGGHRPTFAAKVDLTKEQYDQILAFIENYPFQEYSITKNQCCSFLKQIAALINIQLEDQASLFIDPWVFFEGKYNKMWENPCYSTLVFSSPDVLEQSLKTLVNEGRAENVLSWYRRTHRRCWGCLLKETKENLVLFPERSCRLKFFLIYNSN